MENLPAVLPPSLEFPEPERAVLSTRRTVSVKPTTGTSVTSASSQDIIQFRLPNTGLLASCYLKGKLKNTGITAGSNATNSFAVNTTEPVVDEYAPSASWIRRMVVKASDGTELSNVNNYSRFCSVMARFKNDKEYMKNQGAIKEGGGYNDDSDIINAGFNSVAVDEGGSTDHTAGLIGVSLHNNAKDNFDRLNKDQDDQFIHEFQSGILASNKQGEYMLPLALMGSGMNLELTCNDVGEVFRCVPTSEAGKLTGNALDIHPATGASVDTYDLLDLELVCDLVFMPPEIMSELSRKMCNGLKIVCDNVRQQQNAVTQQDNTIILNQHARSVKSIIAGVKNSADGNNSRREENEYYKVGTAGGSSVSKIQFSVGSEQVPANPISFGAQSYMELEKAFKPIYGEDFKMSNSVDKASYNKTHKTDSAGAGSGGAGVHAGSALFGVNLQSHPEMPSVLSGKSASAGSIPISLNLEFDGSSSLSNNVLETFIISDTVVELLADGSALVSK